MIKPDDQDLQRMFSEVEEDLSDTDFRVSLMADLHRKTTRRMYFASLGMISVSLILVVVFSNYIGELNSAIQYLMNAPIVNTDAGIFKPINSVFGAAASILIIGSLFWKSLSFL